MPVIRTGSMRRSSAPVPPPVPAFTASAGDYRLLEEVGYGANAVVYRAIFTPANRVVAVKCLDLDRVNSNLDDVRRETQTMSLIGHPNVIRSYCSFVVDHNLWVIMPFMSEGSCLHLMKIAYPDGFDESIIASILKETLQALEYLHRQGHIHRDVKAGNILIDNPGVVKLGDFGVSACMFDRGWPQKFSSLEPDITSSLDYDRDKRFSKVMLVTIYLSKIAAHFQLKDAAQLALKKMPSSEQEALSMSEYQRGVSAWNFDIEDLKAQASLIHDDDPTELKEDDDIANINDVDKDVSRGSHFGMLPSSSGNNCIDVLCFSEQTSAAVNPCQNGLETSETLASNLVLDGSEQKADELRNKGPEFDAMPSTSNQDPDGKIYRSEVRQKQRTYSGPILQSGMRSSSMTERGRITGRDAGQLVSDKQKSGAGRNNNLSGPLSLPTRASANSLSAPIRSSAGYVGSLGDKPKRNMVEIKGRFSVTSENVDLVKVQEIPGGSVSRKLKEGPSLRKSASVGDWSQPANAKPMSTSNRRKELCNNSVSASVLIPHLQNLVQQTAFQQAGAGSADEGERSLLVKIFELQSR
ncbi:hypothetical protein PR202_ga27322 [Eleusine coracana subsp. coracana]|uniref:Protein kinase domain-containing protein n=1 Tax=Eleusine coracana subsp. coracana TaxID=191504 RepID=A0AAV5DGG1_ELECO|nr:hypothetical protein PR202_ga27322 [Eleusine coracana subsp. coracana]